MTRSLILAGGPGTRLQSSLGSTPKVLAPVLGRPFVTHLLDRLVSAGVPRTVLATGHGAEEVAQTLGSSYKDMELRYSREETRRGTAGAIRDALPLLDDSFLVLNGDSLCDVDLNAFLADPEAPGSMVLVRVADASRFGSVILEGDRIVRFEEKAPGAGWINAGIYLLNKSLLDEVPQQGEISLERDVFPRHVGSLRGFCCEGRFIDIGTPESYRDAESFFRVRGRKA